METGTRSPNLFIIRVLDRQYFKHLVTIRSSPGEAQEKPMSKPPLPRSITHIVRSHRAVPRRAHTSDSRIQARITGYAWHLRSHGCNNQRTRAQGHA